MIKKMERRFSTVAILVVSTVMLILLITVNAISISENIRRTDASLERMVTFNRDHFERDPMPEDFSMIDQLRKTFDGYNGPPMDREDNRTFEVYLDDSLDFIKTNASEKQLIDETLAMDYAQAAIDNNSTSGFSGEYRYLIVESEEYTRIIFLDYSIERQSEISLIWVSIGVYLASIVLVIILVRLFMKPIMKPIKEAYGKQKQFITDASHELKTPLTVISTDIQVIEMENGETKWTKSINNQVNRLKTLSNELVTLSRMDETTTHLQLDSVNLSDILNDVAMGFEPAINAKDKSLEFDIIDDVKMLGNYDALEKLVSILMHNALKYSNPNGIIRIDLKKDGKKIELIVSNSVETIEKGPHNEFFERFYRADQSRNSKTGGFGIGLAIAKSIVREHKGNIEAYSPTGNELVVKIKFNE